jgi:hypothetical protein
MKQNYIDLNIKNGRRHGHGIMHMAVVMNTNRGIDMKQAMLWLQQ